MSSSANIKQTEGAMSMVGRNTKQLPVILGQPVEPWINLIHNVGLPWVIIVLSAYYGIPFAKDISDKAGKLEQRLDALDAHAIKAMPMLEKSVQAIPLLEAIHRATREGAAQRHQDIKRLQENLEPMPKPDECNE